ncbi:MarR family winged helix-turn-helix transcriptional regulator [Lysinibacillus sp. LZ02]|uniref:MarR family winged helix-turn-helix transcriptional regulator n=1 Tax=Lysinibacillus sp. LZ02 TaxID=3420668 RepID=UPI003D360732
MEQRNQVLHAITVLLRASRSLEDLLKKDMAQYHLNATEFAVLEFLYHKGEQPIQVIGNKILIASSSITYVIDKLEQKGYVKRRGCPNDRRVIYTGITAEGEAFMKEIFPVHEQKMTQLFSCLSNEEVEQMIQHLKTIGLAAENN